MESNFYENLVPSEDNEMKELIKKMSLLLDDTLDSFILLRQRQAEEKGNFEIKFSKKISFQPSVSLNNNESSHSLNQIRLSRYSNHLERLRRIRNMEEDTENLERLIESENIEIVG